MALTLEPEHDAALALSAWLQQRSMHLKEKAVDLNLQGRCSEAIQRITTAISYAPSAADLYLLR